jgi:glycosyltransferase involved in cell wall biosynthesis
VETVVAEYPWPALHAAYLARRLAVPFVLDLPNVEADRFRNTGSRWWPFVAAYERLAIRLARRVFVVSGDDASRLQQRGVHADKLRVVPNGVDPGDYSLDEVERSRTRAELGLADGTRAVLFFGQLSYEPNRRALDTIRIEVAPRLHKRAGRSDIIVAGKHGAGRTQGMRYIGAVSHMRPYINAADVVAVPITSGGGTRLKILEAIACGTPVVSTSMGAEGIDRAACGNLLTVADDWDDFAEALVSPHVKRGNAPPAFLDMYSWASIVSRIEWPD